MADVEEKQPEFNPSFRRIIAYIDRNYMHRLTLADISQSVYLNKTYICQLFAKNLGINFVSYLEQLRITKAQELLRTTTMSPSEIAKQVGYSSPGHFAKVFKKQSGLTPQQYRIRQYSPMLSPTISDVAIREYE